MTPSEELAPHLDDAAEKRETSPLHLPMALVQRLNQYMQKKSSQEVRKGRLLKEFPWDILCCYMLLLRYQRTHALDFVVVVVITK